MEEVERRGEGGCNVDGYGAVLLHPIRRRSRPSSFHPSLESQGGSDDGRGFVGVEED